MSDLVKTASSLGMPFEASPSGRWIRLESPAGRFVYVIQKPWDGPYTVYCESLHQPLPDEYRDPISAIQAGIEHLG